MKPQVEKMINTLAEITFKQDGCKRCSGEYICKKGFNGLLKPLKTVSECYDCIGEYCKKELDL